MTRLTTALLIAALAAAGCAEESEPGGPGADPAPRANGNGNDELQNEENTFTIEAPSAATNITAGGSQAVTISVNREDQFKEAVTLKFTAPPGIRIAPATQEVAAGVDEADVTISADPTARVGEQTIKVTATPASGKNPVDKEFQIEVEAADEGGDPAPATDPANGAATPPAQPAQP